MRILLAIVLMTAPLTRLWACSCLGQATPCSAAGVAAAAFTGTVLNITDLARPLPVGNTVPASNIRPSGPVSALPRPLRVVRMQLGEVLSGVDPGQKEIEIVTGKGGGDCGNPFQTGADYVVYAYKNAE